MASARQPFLASRLQGFGTTIFTEMTRHAQRFDAVNLGQGFPDFDGPEVIRQAAEEALRGGFNQYAPMPGLPALRQAIAEHQRRFYGLEIDPDREVLVTHGATEGVFATLQALCEMGDEVVIFEPFYDSYRASIAMAGAVDRRYTLLAPDFALEPDRLERLITAKTRAILLNSPHNPTGKVFTREELETIARLARQHDLLVISDEVYEHLVFDGEHVPIATLPGMAERTVTVSSAGKTFSFTGWKVGWVIAPAAVIDAVRTAHQFITFSVASPFQPAVAKALALDDEFFRELLESYRSRRDFLCEGLRRVGFEVIEPAGSYFLVADIRPLGFRDDVEFCRLLPELVGVAAIPPTAFYVDKKAGRHLARFAFCKQQAVLEEGLERLRRLPEKFKARGTGPS
ncbi:MAG: pyridoxal phosphate-dependent aminotransferase [Acidobacteriota bacterium]